MRATLGTLAAGLLVLLADNVGGLVVLVGGIWLYHGVSSISKPAADVLGGALLMLVGAFPYLRRR